VEKVVDMVLLLFVDGTTGEVQNCTDVVRRENALLFLDSFGAPVVSFFTEDLLGYTLNSDVVKGMAVSDNNGSLKGSVRRLQRRNQD
jgi:hypothetical protein